MFIISPACPAAEIQTGTRHVRHQ